MRRTRGAAERGRAATDRGEREQAPLHVRIEQMLTGRTRVILPGAQALLGFQLVIVLSDTFETLPASSRLVHGLALLAIALTVVLLITPAALHRIVWAGEECEDVLRIGSHITILALLPLACGMAADAYVVFARITGMTIGSAIAAGSCCWCCLVFGTFGLLSTGSRINGDSAITKVGTGALSAMATSGWPRRDSFACMRD